jgi:hypothetical protein
VHKPPIFINSPVGSGYAYTGSSDQELCSFQHTKDLHKRIYVFINYGCEVRFAAFPATKYDEVLSGEDRDGLRNVGLLTAQPFDPADSLRELHQTMNIPNFICLPTMVFKRKSKYGFHTITTILLQHSTRK